MPATSQTRGKYRAMESRGGREIVRTNDLVAAKALARVTEGVVTQKKRGKEVEIYNGGAERKNPEGDKGSVLDAMKGIHGSDNVMLGKDSGFYVRGVGFVSLSEARKQTGVTAPKRQFRERVGPSGDYATIWAINQPRKQNPYGQLWFDSPRTQLAAWKKLRSAGFTTQKWKDNKRIGTDKPQYFLTYSGEGDPSALERVLMENPREVPEYQVKGPDRLGLYRWQHRDFDGSVYKREYDSGTLSSDLRDKFGGKFASKVERDLKKTGSSGNRAMNPSRNPESGAAELFEEFHGVPSDRIIEVAEKDHWHQNLTELGDLVVLKVRTVTNLDATITFEAGEGEFPVKLASSEDGKQLFFVGGSQELDLATLEMDTDDLIRDSMLIGELYMIHYVTKKAFDKLEETEYFHELSEEGGPLPVLIYDYVNQKLSMAGGSYEVRPEGIVN